MKEDKMYVVPRSGRYTYNNPGFEGVKAGRTAPFQTLWIVLGKSVHKQLGEKLIKASQAHDATFDVYLSANKIPAKYFDDKE